jgi:hypothetical protein
MVDLSCSVPKTDSGPVFRGDRQKKAAGPIGPRLLLIELFQLTRDRPLR